MAQLRAHCRPALREDIRLDRNSGEKFFLNFSDHLGPSILNSEVRPRGCLFT